MRRPCCTQQGLPPCLLVLGPPPAAPRVWTLNHPPLPPAPPAGQGGAHRRGGAARQRCGAGAGAAGCRRQARRAGAVVHHLLWRGGPGALTRGLHRACWGLPCVAAHAAAPPRRGRETGRGAGAGKRLAAPPLTRPARPPMCRPPPSASPSAPRPSPPGSTSAPSACLWRAYCATACRRRCARRQCSPRQQAVHAGHAAQGVLQLACVAAACLLMPPGLGTNPPACRAPPPPTPSLSACSCGPTPSTPPGCARWVAARAAAPACRGLAAARTGAPQVWRALRPWLQALPCPCRNKPGPGRRPCECAGDGGSLLGRGLPPLLNRGSGRRRHVPLRCAPCCHAPRNSCPPTHAWPQGAAGTQVALCGSVEA